jgi:hypothetical protein
MPFFVPRVLLEPLQTTLQTIPKSFFLIGGLAVDRFQTLAQKKSQEIVETENDNSPLGAGEQGSIVVLKPFPYRLWASLSAGTPSG